MTSTVFFGIDNLINQTDKLKDLRLALVCNAASRTTTGKHSRIALKEAGFNLVKLFAPEHGFDAQGADGAFIAHEVDSQTQLPIVSLYSEKLSPTQEDLKDIDLVLIDLPDIGSRFYTYLWTMSYVLESCVHYNKSVLLLDRPNPMAHSIKLAEGPSLAPSCSSFLGRFNIPITHQCTFGELAQYFKSKYYPKLSLEIIKLKNWDRNTNQGYPFFPTSPAIQNRETIYTYAGACLFEGLNINEGRGSDFPFAQFGAPWIDAEKLYNHALNEFEGADLRIVHYTPTISIYEGEECHGLHVLPKQPESFQSVKYFIQLIQLINRLFPGKLKERNYLTNVNRSGTKHLDKLLGIPKAFEQLVNGEINTVGTSLEWEKEISPYLLY
ncbi:MAG: exo-beta-N-acetylmuramidase NamZ domain-containing protein [Sphingobacterium composti]